ncbi:cobalt transporter [Wenyingzhuangia fucanilytica]|uniref:Cobalt transporter n=1 Tax=Wenyingzhuangia fucanilytica TaxID=1790137 RepID=A0A1B1Y755_9FLAO|nr:cation diffusion facilitator family transporter [Wenyingzhuangia fucanilytica]ANW96578.1 cobalt transporter [Wenyingzhuangia fucanilytica]
MSHHHHHHDASKNIRTVFFLNLSFTILEIIGGFYVNSVAIISYAVHDLGDSLSLGFSWYMQEKSKKKPSKKFTFGYKRLSLLGALVNSLVLLTGSIFVIYAAIDRLITPQYSDAKGMLIFAIFGVLVNGYAAWKISSGKTLNERVLSWHLIEDVLGWLAVMIVAIVLNFKNIPYLDPALSILITLYILWNVIKRLKETLYLFLQAQPLDIDIDIIKKEILDISDINTIHHTHIWSLDGERHVFTTHIILKTDSTLKEMLQVKKDIKKILKKYPFDHITIETEFANGDCSM